MELEHTIMRRVMRIASQSRRKLPRAQRGEQPHCRGFGHILDLLTENDGMSQQQIAEMLDIRPQSASEAIANMEQLGLVRKVVSELDRRSSLIYITPEGRQHQQALLADRIQNAKRVMSPLSDTEKQALLHLLNKVTDALQENKEETKWL